MSLFLRWIVGAIKRFDDHFTQGVWEHGRHLAGLPATPAAIGGDRMETHQRLA